MTNTIFQIVWVPESPNHAGLYANKDGDDLDFGKIRTGKKQPSTMDINHALQFNTRAQCEQWCKENSHPQFIPMEHSIEASND